MNKAKFISCPFCGKNPRIIYQGRFCTIVHKNCASGIEIIGTFNNEDSAVKAWNARYAQPCETCSQMSNPDSFISHLLQVEKTCKPDYRGCGDDIGAYYCSNCGDFMDYDINGYKYCYNCGAKVIN